jgi:hypothetical protein
MENFSFRDLLNLPIKKIVSLTAILGTTIAGAFYCGQLYNQRNPSLATPSEALYNVVGINEDKTIKKADLTQKVSKSSKVQEKIWFQTWSSIEKLRQHNQVELLDELENELPLEELSLGKYGYVWAGDIDIHLKHAIPRPVYRDQLYSQLFEIHHIKDKKNCLILYVPKTDIIKLNSGKIRAISGFNHPREETQLMQIDLDKIKSIDSRSIESKGISMAIASISLKD